MYLTTFTGTHFHFDPLSGDDVYGLDIAHSLSNLCRYNGHCPEFYSVAEHCCHLHDWIMHTHFDPDHKDHEHKLEYALAGLFHDAAEAYVGDFVSGLKMTYPILREYTHQIEELIFQRFQLTWPMPGVVVEADKRILQDEFRRLFPGRTPIEEGYIPLQLDIQCWSPKQAKSEFISRAYRVERVRNAWMP